MSERWWSGDPTERFWLESTDRPFDELGTDLKAPARQAGGSGAETWRYSLFKEAALGDLVFHYHKTERAIVGVSTISGTWQARPIVWRARGSYSRDRGDEAKEQDGYYIPLSHFTAIVSRVTLQNLRAKRSELHEIVERISKPGQPAYFPFTTKDSQEVKPHQGYAFKLPRAFVGLFPSLAETVDLVTVLSLPEESGDFDPSTITDSREKVLREIVARQGQPAFRKALLSSYDNQCVISNCSLVEVLEAAHITSYLGKNTNQLSNGLLLRADLHTLWDLHLIAIDPATRKIVIAEALNGSEYEAYRGKPIRSPTRKDAEPSGAALIQQFADFEHKPHASRQVDASQVGC